MSRPFIRALTGACVVLMLGGVTAACSREQRGEPDAKATAAPASSAPPEQAASPQPAMKPDPPGGTGHRDAESEAPHAHEAAAGPVVTLTPIERENIGLKTAKAELRPFEDVRRLPGVLKPVPDRMALVTSRTAGKVVDIHAALGQRVEKGEDLIEVQSVEVEKLQLELLQTEARGRVESLKVETDLTQAQNKLRLAQADADRNRLLVDKGIGARKDFIAAENQLQAVQNEIAGLGRQIELARLSSRAEVEGLIRQLGLLGLPAAEIERMRRERALALLHIPAPISGTVVERPAVLGQVVEPTTTLLKLVDTSVLIAEGSAPEDLVRELRVGQAVRVTVPTYPGERFEGRISFIHPQIDPERRAVHVWAEIRNAGGRLKSDMFVQLSVTVGGGSKTLVIPTAALMSAEGREFVFVETPGGFKRADVLVGARNDEYVEIKRGLEPGAAVITDGKRQVYTVFLAARSGAPALGGHTH
jgi:cobalt-zinc-cadmium efflux system membrane fusion protein